MPGRRPGDASAKRSQAISRLSATSPAGFSQSLATLATSLFGPMPTDAVRPVRARISPTSRRMAAFGATKPERSRYPSSMPTCSTVSMCVRTISQTAAEADR